MDISDLFYNTNYKTSKVEIFFKKNVVDCSCGEGQLILIKSKFGNKSWVECNDESCDFWIPLFREGTKEFSYFPFKQ